ncbi:MAG: inositol monophosphatase family protein, partial [Gemmatimonadota bacterium]
MTTEERRELLDFAVEVAEHAGRSTLEHFGPDVKVERKADGTPVTVADRESERQVREAVAARFPGDAVVGEEFGGDATGGRRWIVDPIDGTKSFIHGVPLYGVLLALEADGEAVLGVLHFPALDETVSAARGLGCWWNGKRARVSSVDRLEGALVLTTGDEAAGEAVGVEAR